MCGNYIVRHESVIALQWKRGGGGEVLLILPERLHEMHYHVLAVPVVRHDDRGGRIFGLVTDFQDTRVVCGEHHVIDQNVHVLELRFDAPAQMTNLAE